MDNPVIIFGAEGLGVAALDIFQGNQVVVYGFLDDNTALHGKEVNGVSILGSTDDDGFLKLIGKKCEAFVATDDNKLRKHLVNLLNERRKVMPINAIHHQAFLSSMATISHGNLFGARTIINTGAAIGNHCIFHAGSVVDYQSKIGDFVQVGAGSVLNANVQVANEVFIGSGVTVVSGVIIGKGARIGAGSVVIENVTAGATVFGNPAKPVGK